MKTVSLVENLKGRGILETHTRYNILVNGVVCGELYFNMTGYTGYLPTASGIVLNCGEGAISRFKKELPRINREFSEAGEVAYYQITLSRTKPIDDTDTARQIANMRNTEFVVCRPFPALSSEAQVENAVASGSFRVVDKAIEAGRISADERNLVQGIMRVPEADYWKKRLVQH